MTDRTHLASASSTARWYSASSVAILGKGRIKDDQRPASATGRQIRLVGSASDSEIRVHRGGIAILSAMFSRAYVQDLRQARKNGTHPTVDDPTRAIG